jgi:hypothetical protein
MTAKQKAWKLFNKYYSYLKANLMYDEEAVEDAKVCALIAVDEILDDDMYGMDEEHFEERINYWEKVKQEIELL